MKHEHTPGPWATDGDLSTALDIVGNGHRLAMMDEQSELADEEIKANAQLVATAPELLRALIDLLNVTPRNYDNRHEHAAAEDAIYKALGA